MKDKILRNLNALEHLINGSPELFHDGINDELIDIIKDSKSIIKNDIIPKEKENLIEFENIIKQNRYSMLFLFIYYNLKCNDNLEFDIETCGDNSLKQIHSLINFIYEAYMKDIHHTDLGYICDKAVEHKNKILNNKWTKWDLLKSCYFNN